jgi:dTDP-4-dehydrorhamnose 3,5-epimerase-like enzyme
LEQVRKIKFPEHGDDRGHLVIVEGGKDVPFDIRRIFYIYGSDQDVVRGQHANRKSEFVLVNIAGVCKVKVLDGRGHKEIFVLDKPHEGIHLPAMYWKDMYDFSPNSLLLVLSSEHYDPSEYIRDYDAFVNEVNGYA